MPSTGWPALAWALMPAARPRSRSHPDRKRWPCCPGSRPRRRRQGRRDRSPSAPARPARRPAPRHRWSSKCAAAGSRPPAASPRRAVAAGPDNAVREHRHRILGVEPEPVGVGNDAVGRPAGQVCSCRARAPAARGRRETCSPQTRRRVVGRRARERPPSQTGARAARRGRCRRGRGRADRGAGQPHVRQSVAAG